MLEEKAEFPVSLMARALEASRSGFYSWLASGCPRDSWAAERDAVMRVGLETDRRFGFRFAHAMLPLDFSHLTRYRASFVTRVAAKHAVIESIEADHNRRRPHSTIGYQIPANAMKSFFERTKPAEEGLPMAA